MQNRKSNSLCLSSHGAISPLGLLLLLASMTASAGLIGLYYSWQKAVQTQFRLDLCVSKESKAIRQHMNFIVNTNRILNLLRAGRGLTFWCPPCVAAEDYSSKTVVLMQTAAIQYLEFKKAAWLNPFSCGDFSDQKSGYPPIRWRRPMQDPLGPRALQWAGGSMTTSDLPDHLDIRVTNRKQTSAGIIFSADPTDLKNLLKPVEPKIYEKGSSHGPVDKVEYRFLEPYQIAWGEL